MKSLCLVSLFLGLVLIIGCGSGDPPEGDDPASGAPPAKHLYSKHKEVLDKAKKIQELSNKRYEQIDGDEQNKK